MKGVILRCAQDDTFPITASLLLLQGFEAYRPYSLRYKRCMVLGELTLT